MGIVAAAKQSDPLNQMLGFFSADLDQPCYHRFLTGGISLFTHSAPDKSTGNEDAVAVVPINAHAGVLIVADGVGGHVGGAEAARLTIEQISQTIKKVDAGFSLRDAILDGIELANGEVLALKTGAAATLAVVEIDQGIARPYHVGDTLILITGQRGKVKFENIPHSPVGYAVEAGLIDKDDAVHHTARNLVSNVVGSNEMRIDIGPTIALSPRDTLLVASDSISDNFYGAEIVNSIRKGPLKKISVDLIYACRDRMTRNISGQPGHSDDTTFILYRPNTSSV